MTPNLAPDLAMELHYSVEQIAVLWGLSRQTVERWFENEPGVLRFGHDETPTKRPHITLRIPASVAVRVHRDKRI